jgi:pimeloyl-ACP methyl ester carboxylesterase
MMNIIKFNAKFLALVLIVVFLFGCARKDIQTKRAIAYSEDNVPISYTVYGTGDLSVVFVHGWSCDSRYWDKQVPEVSKKYQVITIDLAGHGHSGSLRDKFTIDSFGQDVKAVIDQEKVSKMILIGHSMGGQVIVAAARLMPKKVIGLIGVDTLMNVEAKYSQEFIDGMLTGFKKDFPKHTDSFVREMFRKNTDKKLVDWVTSDMAAANPKVAISAVTEYLQMFVTGQTSKVFEGLEVPVRAITADLWPVDYDGNRRHMHSFNAVIMPNTGHFLMLERPDEFNKILLDTINWILQDNLRGHEES